MVLGLCGLDGGRRSAFPRLGRYRRRACDQTPISHRLSLLLRRLYCAAGSRQRRRRVARAALLRIANIAFDLGFLFCSAFLVEISTPHNIGRISGYGWGLGYVGGLLSLALAYPLISGGFAEENLPYYRLSFTVTAGFFLLAALPTFLWLHERAIPQAAASS